MRACLRGGFSNSDGHPIKLGLIYAKFNHCSDLYIYFQHAFLEIVEIRVKKGSEEIINEVITTFGALVKTIRKIVIL